MWSWRLAGTRARAVQPASATEANMCVAVSQSTRLCSMSTVSQAKPARARKRAAVMLPSDSHVPTAGWPARSAFLTGFARIAVPLPGASDLLALQPGHLEAVLVAAAREADDDHVLLRPPRGLAHPLDDR